MKEFEEQTIGERSVKIPAPSWELSEKQDWSGVEA
jgi:hypothetical protein